MTSQTHIDIDEREPGVIVVTGGEQIHSRPMRRFFRSVLGGEQTSNGWRVSRRGTRQQDLILRIHNFLAAAGHTVTSGEIADRSLELALERQRGITRSREEATAWKNGHSIIDDDRVADHLESLGWQNERRLFPHQLRNVGHALSATNHANFSVPGAGKTATALAVAVTHYEASTIDIVMMVGPLAAFEPWESEARAALGARFITHRVRGDVSRRRAMYKAVRRGDLLLMSYATAAADRPAIKDMFESMNAMLIVDESHRVKRFRGGLWAPSLAEIAELARVRMILSGTPMPNGPRDLYSQLNILWPGGLLTGTRDHFASRVDRSFSRVLEDIGPFTTRTAKHELGLPPYRLERHSSDMKGTQAEIYQLIHNRLKGLVSGAGTWKDKIDTLRRARPIRLLQAATNPDLLNHADDRLRLPSLPNPNPTLFERLARFAADETATKPTTAIELIRHLADEGKKVTVWSNFLRNLDSFSQRVNLDLGIPAFQVDGRIPTGDDPSHDDERSGQPADDTREARIEQFLSHDGPAVLVTNPATSSESISLHRACHHAIYLDRTYDAALFLQSIDRIHRLGLAPDAEVTVHILQATIDGEETIDHLIDLSLRAKQAEMERLLEGAEIHPLYQETAEPDGTDVDIEALLRFLIGEESDEDA